MMGATARAIRGIQGLDKEIKRRIEEKAERRPLHWSILHLSILGRVQSEDEEGASIRYNPTLAAR